MAIAVFPEPVGVQISAFFPFNTPAFTAFSWPGFSLEMFFFVRLSITKSGIPCCFSSASFIVRECNASWFKRLFVVLRKGT